MEKLTRIHLYVLLFFCFFALRQLFKFTHIISAEIIQGRKLFKGGNYKLLGEFDHGLRKLFKGGNYSRAETIHENTVVWVVSKISKL